MTSRTPHQNAALTAFREAMDAQLAPLKEHLTQLTSEQMDDVFANALAALTPHDVAAFWLPNVPTACIADGDGPRLLAALINLVNPDDFDQHPEDFGADWHAARRAIAIARREPRQPAAPQAPPTATIIMLPFIQHERHDDDHADSTTPSAEVVQMPIRG